MWYNKYVIKGRKTQSNQERKLLMKYNVIVNPTKRSITVEYEGYKGTARCCPTDTFDMAVGTELALERAKVAKRMAETPAKNGSVMELVKALEKALPKGQMVIVGNGKEMTAEQKAWLHSLTDCEGGYDEGYEDGYADAQEEYEECEDCDRYTDAMRRIVAILDEVGAID
jgi:hypothetical protein